MKRAVILLLLCLLMLTGCGTKKAEQMPENGMMTIVDSTTGYTIYVHDETGVMYFSRDGGYGCSVCVMVDTDGKPLIYNP